MAKGHKIGTISRPIDSNDIIELNSIDSHDVTYLDFVREEEANIIITHGNSYFSCILCF